MTMKLDEAAQRAELNAYRVARLAHLLGTRERPGQAAQHRRFARRFCALGRLARAAGLDLGPFVAAARKHRAIALEYGAEERRLVEAIRAGS